jgi:hypothetical protein
MPHLRFADVESELTCQSSCHPRGCLKLQRKRSLSSIRMSTKAVRNLWVHRLDGRVVNCGVAVHATCLMNHKICRTDGEREGSQAFQARDQDRRLGRCVPPDGRDPDRSRCVGPCPNVLLKLRGRLHELEQALQARRLFVECIRSDSVRNTLAREGPAGRNHVDPGNPPPNHGEQFKAGHSRHVEIGEQIAILANHISRNIRRSRE